MKIRSKLPCDATMAVHARVEIRQAGGIMTADQALPFQIAGAEWLGEQSAKPPQFGDCGPPMPKIDFGPAIAFPGLVNSHDHLEFNCYPPLGTPLYGDFTEWSRDVHADHAELVAMVEAIPRSARLRAGLLKNLLWGVTAVAHHGRQLPTGLAAPIRIIAEFDVVHSPEFEWRGRLEFLKAWRRRPVVAHLAEGTTGESRDRALQFMRWNVFRRPLVGVHGVALKAPDFGRLDGLVWCPASNQFLLGQTADIASASRSTAILFGTDAAISAPGTLWDHFRIARQDRRVSERDLFQSVTAGATKFWRLNDGNGDFVVARRREREPWAAFFAITPADILLVVSQGQVVLVDQEIAASCADRFWPLCAASASVANKRVAIDTARMVSDFRQHAPVFDVAGMMQRFMGDR
jgi:cytosine/adenosine deaminase-related metal-dependent hydrolase